MQGQVLLRAERSRAQRGWDSVYSSLGARDATNSRCLAPEPTPPGRPAGGRMGTGPQRGGHRLPAPHGVGVGVALQLQQRRSLAAGSQVGERSCRGDEGGGIGPSPGTLNLQGPGSRQLPVSGMCFPRMGREQALSLSTIQGKRAAKRSGVCLNGPANNRERDLRYVNVRGCADPGSTGDNDGTSPPA